MLDPYTVIRTVHLTEKSESQTEEYNKYTFRVATGANKAMIADSIKQLFDVDVVSVRTLNYSGKKKRMRSAVKGKRADWKKAIVTLKAEDTIELF
jgi:large subunit ribosomal protein L23